MPIEHRGTELNHAGHWRRVTEDFLRGVDMLDIMEFFPDAGLSDEERNVMLSSIKKIHDYSVETLKPKRAS